MYVYSLPNAISAYHTYVDITFKLFTYLQIVAAAAAGFAWSDHAESASVLILALVVYTVFAAGNLYLIIDAHGRAIHASQAIMKFWQEKHEEIAPTFHSLARIYRCMNNWQLYVIHIFVDAFACGVIVWRLTQVR